MFNRLEDKKDALVMVLVSGNNIGNCKKRPINTALKMSLMSLRTQMWIKQICKLAHLAEEKSISIFILF